MMLLCLSWSKRQLSWQKLSAGARTLHVQPGWGTSVASGKPAAVWYQGGSVPAAAAFCTAPWGQHDSSAGQGSQQTPHQLAANFHASGPTLILGVWRSYGIACVCVPAQALYLDRVSTANSEQQERINRKASVSHGIINSVFPIRLYVFWFGLSLTPLTAACCWLVSGIQGWEDVPILSRVSALCSALTAGGSCLVQWGLIQPASQQQEGKCSGKFSRVMIPDFSLTSAFKINNLQTHPFIPSWHFAKQLEQSWKKQVKF